MVKYVFFPGSLKGLNDEIVVYARTYEDAKRRLIKCIHTGRIQECVHNVEEENTPWSV